ncbi:hypothetical protein B0H13DRAFT_2317268 [Mycena leptocephala]|nr:hypothetical protein B0H13DRAFT_2317268 [Mycena leptocephala]
MRSFPLDSRGCESLKHLITVGCIKDRIFDNGQGFNVRVPVRSAIAEVLCFRRFDLLRNQRNSSASAPATLCAHCSRLIRSESQIANGVWSPGRGCTGATRTRRRTSTCIGEGCHCTEVLADAAISYNLANRADKPPWIVTDVQRAVETCSAVASVEQSGMQKPSGDVCEHPGTRRSRIRCWGRGGSGGRMAGGTAGGYPSAKHPYPRIGKDSPARGN